MFPLRIMTLFALLATFAGCAFTENRSVSVLPEHLVCQTDSDCTEVLLSCSSCGEVVAKQFAPILVAQRRQLCKRYRGPVVDCNPPPGVMCRAGMCVYAPFSSNVRPQSHN